MLPPECGGGAVQRRGDNTWILIDPTASPVHQRCRLAHELVHLDRGSWRCRYSPQTMDDKVAREESRVDAEVADWLVDHHELWVVVGDMVSAGEDVTRRVVAQHFQVTKPIAGIALDRLARTHGIVVPEAS